MLKQQESKAAKLLKENQPLALAVQATARRLGRGDAQQEAITKEIETLVGDVLENQPLYQKGEVQAIEARIAKIDELLNAQLNAIMHHPKFQKLEASWRGLDHLVQRTESNEKLTIRALDVTEDELYDDVSALTDKNVFNSALFKQFFERALDTLGAPPYAVLIGDFEFKNTIKHLALLEGVSRIASLAHAPFIAAAHPEMFSKGDFTELSNDSPEQLKLLFEGDAYIRWRAFRKWDNARYVALTMPHFLLRNPYTPDVVKSFSFNEDVTGRDHGKYLWGNAAFAYAARLTDSFTKSGWCMATLGPENGGTVSGLPTHTFSLDGGSLLQVKCPTELVLPDQKWGAIADLGFIPLVYRMSSTDAVFFTAPTVQSPQVYLNPEATENADMSAQLQYIMAASRFGHYVKAIMREHLGRFSSAEDCQIYMHNWLSQSYVLPPGDDSREAKAKYPLKSAQVMVRNIPSKQGYYEAVLHLQPHDIFRGLSASIRLVAKLPPPQK